MRVWAACHWRLVVAGFRRYSTYRQATLAGLTTNVVFGLLRTAVLVAVFTARAPGTVGGYDAAATTTYVWLGQGLLAVVLLWGNGELAERIRTGDVVVDLYRPWNQQTAGLATDLGRAAYAVLTRGVPPMVLGMLLFPFRWPRHGWTWLCFATSILLSVLVSFAIRFLVDVTTFWLLDVRGVAYLYAVCAGLLGGLAVPLGFFPEWARAALWATPFPDLLQAPIDVFVENGRPATILVHQGVWAVIVLVAGRLLLRRAVRRLVVQGG